MFDIVAIATSAGGLVALSQVLGSLPANFPAAIVVVQHLDPHGRTMLPQILARRSPLQVQSARLGDRIQAGTVYVAPPDKHMLINANGMIMLTSSAQINFSRPSADSLFESVAKNFKQRAIAIVLTGMGKDGAHGIELIKQMGGVTIAQDEATAQFASMPHAAIQTDAVDLILPLQQIAPTLIRLVMGEKD